MTAEVRLNMNPQLSTLTRRIATFFVAVVFVSAAATPVSAAACCRTRSNMAFMHGTMSCCKNCKITTPEDAGVRDVGAIPAPTSVAPAFAVAAVAVPQAPAPCIGAGFSITTAAASPPPQFLLNAQFRI